MSLEELYERGIHIADLFDVMPHNPDHPFVKSSSPSSPDPEDTYNYQSNHNPLFGAYLRQARLCSPVPCTDVVFNTI